MTSKSDAINDVLKDLKSKYNVINACMVAKKGLEGVIMFPESFKQEVAGCWEPLSSTINDILGVISEKSVYNLEQAYLEILGYGISFYVLPSSDTALILFIQRKENVDVLDFISKNSHDMLAARDKIIHVIEDTRN